MLQKLNISRRKNKILALIRSFLFQKLMLKLFLDLSLRQRLGICFTSNYMKFHRNLLMRFLRIVNTKLSLKSKLRIEKGKILKLNYKFLKHLSLTLLLRSVVQSI